tara:strand:+ start:97590 stop:97904 length:315 start_codon:yes stop_codon:yes gene_type:complete
MLRHCVFLNFDAAHSGEARMKILAELGALVKEVDGMVGFEYGPNLDFEQKSPNYREGFIASFRDHAALSAYAEHPVHQALGARLAEMCVGGFDGIIVFDLDVAD